MGNPRSPARRLGKLRPATAAGKSGGRVRYRIGTVEEFPEGEFCIFDLGGHEIGVIRTPDGFRAVANACPHQGAAICLGRVTGTWLESAPGDYVYGLDGDVLRCPWHSWEFRISDGSAVGGITAKRLTTYPVSIEGDQVFVSAGRVRGHLDSAAASS